jgi:hypothetical protein
MRPKAKKKPIDAPYHPSLNQWMVMRRPMANALKHRWKDFMVWFIKREGYDGLGISECEMTFTAYFKTRIRHDTDNYAPKFMLDGLVDSGFIVDDDSLHLKSLTLQCGYDKLRPRTEISVRCVKLEDSNSEPNG